jgi:hypothetical protein
MAKVKENRLVVGDISWAADIPEWLTAMVASDRVISGLMAIKNDTEEQVGDPEILVYLSMASQRAPIPSALVEVMTWLTARVMSRKHCEDETEWAVPDFLVAKLNQGLTREEQFELDELRRMIYSKRGGRISHPLLDALREFKRDLEKMGDGPVQQSLF